MDLSGLALFRFEILNPEQREKYGIKARNRFDCTHFTDLINGGYRGLDPFRNKEGMLFLYKVPTKGNRENWKGYQGAAFNLTGQSMNLTAVTMGGTGSHGHGFPNQSAYLNDGKKPNPLFKYRGDLYLFIIPPKGRFFELLVVPEAKVHLNILFRELEVGKFEKGLMALREMYQPYFPY